MEKKVNKKVFITLALYLVITLIGTIVMSFPAFGYLNPVYYASILFYTFAFFNVIAYFFGRDDKNKSYELLYFCLINIVAASYLFISNYAEAPTTLGTGFLIYTLLVAVNRVYHMGELKKKKDTLWIVRAMATVLILFLGILTIQNFYREITEVQTLMIGYYFITFGVVSILETLVIGFVSTSTFEHVLNGEIDMIKEERKVKKSTKPKKKSKKTNENVEELDEIVKSIEVPKKKKKTKKVTKKVTKK